MTLKHELLPAYETEYIPPWVKPPVGQLLSEAYIIALTLELSQHSNTAHVIAIKV